MLLNYTLVCFRYESHENMAIQCSTKVCSFGKQVCGNVIKTFFVTQEEAK